MTAKHKRCVAVVGSSVCDAETLALAREVGNWVRVADGEAELPGEVDRIGIAAAYAARLSREAQRNAYRRAYAAEPT